MTNETLLTHYMFMKQEIKRLEKEIEVIAKHIKETGSFSTPNFLCIVEERERTGLKSLDEVSKAIDPHILQEYGLIQVTKYKVITVSKKD